MSTNPSEARRTRGQPAGTPLRHKAPSLGLTKATRETFVRSVLTLDTLQNGGDGVRRWIVALHACDETAFDSAKLRWLPGYKPSANVGGTGSVPEGRKEGAYGQL